MRARGIQGEIDWSSSSKNLFKMQVTRSKVVCLQGRIVKRYEAEHTFPVTMDRNCDASKDSCLYFCVLSRPYITKTVGWLKGCWHHAANLQFPIPVSWRCSLSIPIRHNYIPKKWKLWTGAFSHWCRPTSKREMYMSFERDVTHTCRSHYVPQYMALWCAWTTL